MSKVLPPRMTEAEFTALSVTERRKLVMADVILHVRAERLIGQTGAFVSLDPDSCSSLPVDGVDTNDWEKMQLGDDVTREAVASAPCEVCARGAIFYAIVMRTNNCNVYELSQCQNEDERISDRLGLFTRTERRDIESIFEGWGHQTEDLEGAISREAYVEGYHKFYKRFGNDSERLVAIALNIIACGKFDPTVEITEEEVEAALKT